MRPLLATLASAVFLLGCGTRSGGSENENLERDIAKAEAFIDAFYSFDPSRLGALLDRAEKSRPDILFYQGWAEGGNYKVVDRKPCTSLGANSIACPVTVDDDLINALGIAFDVTDTFTLTFSHGEIVAVDTGSNDPPQFHAAEEWVRRQRPELIDEPCGDDFSSPTPGECVRAMVQGYKEFASLQESTK
jgi:hypothetical protein